MKKKENEEPKKNLMDVLNMAELEARRNASGDLEQFKRGYFHFGEYELQKYKEFVKKQLATKKITYGFCGGNFSIIFCPTGIGVDVIAKCYDTGASESLVDPESW